jgi:hypothetical protein
VKFVDDFGMLAVEKCLLELLASIFSPRVVESLLDRVVEEIAAEDETSKAGREKLEEKARTLSSALSQIRRFGGESMSSKVAHTFHVLD